MAQGLTVGRLQARSVVECQANLIAFYTLRLVQGSREDEVATVSLGKGPPGQAPAHLLLVVRMDIAKLCDVGRHYQAGVRHVPVRHELGFPEFRAWRHAKGI